MIFEDRHDAGKKLASKLAEYKDKPDVIVIGLPRGGVVVAFEVAQALNLPLDIIVPRKIGAPGNPELAIGAISEEGEGVFDESFIQAYGVSQEFIQKEIEAEKLEAHRRLELYRGKTPPLSLKEKTALLIDDGIATGSTMLAAILSAKSKGARKVVVAAPVAAAQTVERIKKEADQVIVMDAPLGFEAVGLYYENFLQTEDEEIVSLMERNNNSSS